MADPKQPTEPADPTGSTKTETHGISVNLPLATIVFLVLASHAVISITEISARSSFLGRLQSQVNSINQELAQNDIPEDETRPSSGNLSPEDEVRPSSRDLASARLERAEESYARLEMLISLGADDTEQTLAGIRRTYEGRSSEKQSRFFTPIRERFAYLALGYLSTLNSDYLLAIAIMTCGALGATIASIRNTRELTWHSVLFGLAAGFIVFLSIKGGRHIFLIQAQGQMAQFNPYSSGFLGLIAGMFTERTFELLSAVTDAVFQKIKKVLEE